MRLRLRLAGNEKGAAAIEMAFALPVLVIMIWAFVQLAQVYRALAGIQQALGQGARYATLCLDPSFAGCTSPTAQQVKDKIDQSVYGLGPGTFTTPLPTSGTAGTSKYYDLRVTYTQPTSLLLMPGPTMTMSRTKRVWISTST
jgi:Flp pilus assembly protein TadG